MIFAKNFARKFEKNSTWNIRHLVDELFVPATQHIILKIVGFQLIYQAQFHMNFSVFN